MVFVLGALLAGCSDDASSGDASGIELAEVDNTATTGSISGVVVDDAIRPLGGVNLTLLGLERATATDDQGLFIFDQLEPGLYTVSAASYTAVDGRLFLGIQTTADVVAGQTAKVRIVLPNDPTPQPYHTVYKWDAYDEVTAAVVDGGYEILRQAYANDTAPPLCDACTFFLHPEGPAETFLLEAVWEDSVADPTGEATHYFYEFDALDTEAETSDYCASPCRIEVGGNAYNNATTIRFSMYPDENWVAYQQRWQMFVTVWYLAPPPDDWSVVAGDL